MIMSKLARKVVDETGLQADVLTAFWVEQKLQKYILPGVMQMIAKSKEKTPDYIDGYWARYKWALRPECLQIADHFWVYELFQQFDHDFVWDLWPTIVKLDPKTDFIFLDEAIKITMMNSGIGTGQANYALAISESKKSEVLYTIAQTKSYPAEAAQARDISPATKRDWSSIERLIG